MSARTKTPPTDDRQCTLAFMGPMAQAEAARAALHALGFQLLARDLHAEDVTTHARDAVNPVPQRRGAGDRRERAQAVLAFTDETSASVPWREAFPPLEDT